MAFSVDRPGSRAHVSELRRPRHDRGGAGGLRRRLVRTGRRTVNTVERPRAMSLEALAAAAGVPLYSPTDWTT